MPNKHSVCCTAGEGQKKNMHFFPLLMTHLVVVNQTQPEAQYTSYSGLCLLCLN